MAPIRRSRPIHGLVCLLVSILASQGSAAEPDDLAARLGQGLARFVEDLDARQRNAALYAFDDAERFDLRLAPLGLEGLRLDEMSESQWRTLESLLGGVLSAEGLTKLNTIRSLEREVAELEGGLFGFVMGRLRDAKRYFLTLYGEPGADAPWALRFDGHHLSLNWTAVPEAPLSVTPLFLGGQPRVVPQDLPRAGLRVLAEEEERAVAFLNGLRPDQRALAFLPWREGSAIRRPMSIAGEVDLALGMPPGLPREALGAASRARFDALVDVHLENFAKPIADRLKHALRGGPGPVTIVYAAAADDPALPVASGRALYYRIQGGGLLIEFDDTAEAADHIHVVLRHPANDFGRDILAEHLAGAHDR